MLLGMPALSMRSSTGPGRSAPRLLTQHSSMASRRTPASPCVTVASSTPGGSSTVNGEPGGPTTSSLPGSTRSSCRATFSAATTAAVRLCACGAESRWERSREAAAPSMRSSGGSTYVDTVCREGPSARRADATSGTHHDSHASPGPSSLSRSAARASTKAPHAHPRVCSRIAPSVPRSRPGQRSSIAPAPKCGSSLARGP
mmetsp:Transcript_24271/g.82951  ORF Transcript_24271/g.82951 Transcript_24271/m.82951 type:complete len:201 (-) Transcript_24271:1299-1901(-)